MLSHENRINTKNELKDWIEYERKKYVCVWGGTAELYPLSRTTLIFRDV